MPDLAKNDAIAPCLWFDGQAEEAAKFYVGIFADSSVDKVWRAGDGLHIPADTAMLVEFTLRGQPFQGLNGGPGYPHTQAMSLSVDCADQAEVDRIWDGLAADGGSPVQCGWVKDRFGVSWQVVPRMMGELQRSGTPAQVGRMMAAMMTMVKLDIAALQAAFAGDR